MAAEQGTGSTFDCTETAIDVSQRALDDLLATLAAPLRIHSVLANLSTVPASWGFTQRRLDEHLLYLCIDGRYRVTFDGAERELAAGSALWLPPGCVHSLRLPLGVVSMTLYHFRFRLWCGARELRLGAPSVVPHADGTVAWGDAWLRACRHPGAHAAARQRALLVLLASDLYDALQQRHAPGLDAGRRRRLESHVARHIGQPLDSADLARHLGLSRSYFVRLFRRAYGVAPRTWLVAQRIAQARLLLAGTTLPVTTIAARLGYRNVPLFCRQFRAATGTSPQRYRSGLA